MANLLFAPENLTRSGLKTPEGVSLHAGWYKIANRITPACPYIFPSARRRSGMVARQVRRSVVMSNLQIRLLPMDSDRAPLGKGKNVLHGAVRAAPLEHSVEQPCPTVRCAASTVLRHHAGCSSLQTGVQAV